MSPILTGLKHASICFIIFISTLPANPFDIGRFNFTSGQKQVEVPFHTFNNQVIISVVLNNKIPLNFVLDSGSSQAILFDRQLARDMGVTFDRRVEFSGAGNTNRVVGYRSTGVKLDLPGISGEMMGMVVLNEDYLNMKQYDIHGVLGYQIFIRFAVMLDYDRKIMTLMEPDQYDASEFHAFDLTVENSKPYIETEIFLADNSRIPSRLMIDTGAAYGLTLITGTHPAIQPPKKAQKVRLASGLGGEIRGYNGITQIKVSRDLAPEVITMYIDPDEYTQKGHFKYNKTGSLGGEFLKNYLVIIDYINYKAFIQPQTPTYLTQNDSQ